jgi:hypothetical protein
MANPEKLGFATIRKYKDDLHKLTYLKVGKKKKSKYV